MTQPVTDWPAHACAAEILTGSETMCSFCQQTVVRGRTTKGNPSVFDPEPPYVNHWITCPARKRAEAFYKARRQRR